MKIDIFLKYLFICFPFSFFEEMSTPLAPFPLLSSVITLHNHLRANFPSNLATANENLVLSLQIHYAANLHTYTQICIGS